MSPGKLAIRKEYHTRLFAIRKNVLHNFSPLNLESKTCLLLFNQLPGLNLISSGINATVKFPIYELAKKKNKQTNKRRKIQQIPHLAMSCICGPITVMH